MGDMKNFNVLITGGGAPGIAGTIYALRNNPEDIHFKVIVTDINDEVVGKYLADGFYKVPPPEDEKYIPILQEISRKEKVKVILPQTTREITVLSKNIKKFTNLGVAIVVSPFESIKIANDKFLLLEKANEIKVPYPTYYLTNSESSLVNAIMSLGYPKKKVVVKPRISSGMRGLRIISEEIYNVQRFLNEKPTGVEITLNSLLEILHKSESWPELLVTEYLPGLEYTTDVFRGKYGTIVIPRLRERIRSGITFDAKIEMRNDLIEYSLKLGEALNLIGCFGFQFKLSEDGIPKLLECNPRVQGTMVCSMFAGANIIYYAVMEALGRHVKIDCVKIRNHLEFKRYWGGVAIYDGNSIGKI